MLITGEPGAGCKTPYTIITINLKSFSTIKFILLYNDMRKLEKEEMGKKQRIQNQHLTFCLKI